jgi:hypothetical protein
MDYSDINIGKEHDGDNFRPEDILNMDGDENDIAINEILNKFNKDEISLNNNHE